MHLTGIAGQIVGFAVLVVAYTIIILGLYVAVYWILIEWIGRAVLRATKAYSVFIQYVYNRKRFKKWLKDQNNQPHD